MIAETSTPNQQLCRPRNCNRNFLKENLRKKNCNFTIKSQFYVEKFILKKKIVTLCKKVVVFAKFVICQEIISWRSESSDVTEDASCTGGIDSLYKKNWTKPGDVTHRPSEECRPRGGPVCLTAGRNSGEEDVNGTEKGDASCTGATTSAAAQD